eukprot:6232527-Pyramimonas_sp.AAC.1
MVNHVQHWNARSIQFKLEQVDPDIVVKLVGPGNVSISPPTRARVSVTRSTSKVVLDSVQNVLPGTRHPEGPQKVGS